MMTYVLFRSPALWYKHDKSKITSYGMKDLHTIIEYFEEVDGKRDVYSWYNVNNIYPAHIPSTARVVVEDKEDWNATARTATAAFLKILGVDRSRIRYI